MTSGLLVIRLPLLSGRAFHCHLLYRNTACAEGWLLPHDNGYDSGKYPMQHIGPDGKILQRPHSGRQYHKPYHEPVKSVRLIDPPYNLSYTCEPKKPSAAYGPKDITPFFSASWIAGIMISSSSLPNNPASPACGFKARTAIRGRTIPKSCLSD